MAKHAGAQERLRRELTLAAAGRNELSAEMAELPYAEMVIMSLSSLPAQLDADPSSLPGGIEPWGYRVPRGSWLYVFPYVIHREARWFTQPDLFDPDRFAPEKFGALQRSAYMPFGLGPRLHWESPLTIILTTMLACILQRLRLELAADQLDLGPTYVSW